MIPLDLPWPGLHQSLEKISWAGNTRPCGTLRVMTRNDDGTPNAVGPTISPQELRALCGRIVAFLSRKAEKERILLPYIVEQHIAGRVPIGEELRQEMGAGGRPPAQVNAAAQVVVRIREKLDEYFAAHPEEKIRISIPVGEYGLAFALNTLPPERRFYADEFWADHRSPADAVTVIYTEPLFVRDKEFKEFTRRVNLNSRNSGSDLREGQEYVYSHVPLGEVVATLKLIKKFWGWRQTTLEQGCRREVEFDELIKASTSGSFIVLGAPRANGFIHSIQLDSELEISVAEDSVDVANAESPEEPSYAESTLRNIVTGYVVVTRLRRMSRYITMFHGNHGQAIARLVEIFVDDGELRTLYREHLPELLAGSLPDQFQLLFRVTMDRRGERAPEKVELLAKRPRPWPPSARSSASDVTSPG